MIIRILLALTSLGFFCVYTFTVWVALCTSGSDLVKDPVAYYVAIVPLLYFIFCFVSAVSKLSKKVMIFCGIVLHVALVPCLFSSFLHIVDYAPILVILWLIAYWKFYIKKDAP